MSYTKTATNIGIVAVIIASILICGSFVKAEEKPINEPYINQEYLDYLALPDEEKAKIDVIPEMYSLDVDADFAREAVESGKGRIGDIDENIVRSDNMPSYFDLRNVDGNNYLTPLKNQQSTGICWAFTSMEQTESLVMFNTGTPYSSTTTLLSPRQLDYANSTNGINNYENENGMRKLLYGGNFFMSSLTMMNGISLIPESTMPFDESQDKKELAEVLNYDNSVYEVDSTIMMPNFTDNDLFVEYTKGRVMTLGGGYVATGSPQGACAAKNVDGTYIIMQDNDCSGDKDYGPHAMHVIGWDDNYSYSYCKVGTKHASTSNGSCKKGTLVSGAGAWILRNSWGDDAEYGYVYLAFDSADIDVDFVSGVSTMADREWDNNYHKNVYQKTTPTYGVEQSSTFEKKISGAEKINKIKFLTLSMWRDYTVSIRSASSTYENVATFTVVWPGIYTVSLSDKNIILNDDTFTVTVSSADGGQILEDTISVFTENIDKTPVISTGAVVSAEDVLETGDFSTILYSETKNIPSNATIDYKLMKGDTDYSQYLTVENNTVAINNVNATITVDKVAGYGDFKIIASYGGQSYEIPLNLKTSLNIAFSSSDLIEEKEGIVIINSGSFEKLLSLVSTNATNPTYLHYDKDMALVDDDELKTGDTLTAKLSDNVEYSYKIVVLGDINSDGKVSSADYIKIRKHIMETEVITSGLHYYAADVNKDNSISSADYIKIRKYIMNGGTL